MSTDRHFGLFKESSYGVPGAATDYFELIREDLEPVPNYLRLQTVRSMSVRAIPELTMIVRGTTEILAGYQELPLLFYALLGGADTTGSGPYTHTEPGAAGLGARPSFTAEVKRDSDDNTFRYPGAICTSLAIAATLQDIFKATIGWVAKEEIVTGDHVGTHTGSADAATLTDSAAEFPASGLVGWKVNNTTDGSSGTITANTATTITATLSGGTDNDWDTGDAYTITPPTASYPTLDIVVPKHCTVKIDTVAIDAQAFNFNASWPVDEPNKLGSRFLARTPEDSEAFQIAGDITLLYDDPTQNYKFYNEQDVDLQLVADSGGDESLTINLDACRLVKGTPHIEGRTRQVQVLNFEAFNTGVLATDPIQIVGINDDAALF